MLRLTDYDLLFLNLSRRRWTPRARTLYLTDGDLLFLNLAWGRRTV
jgi:hypothetical protein